MSQRLAKSGQYCTFVRGVSERTANLYMKDWFRLCHRSQRALVVLPGFMILFLVSSFDTNSFFVSNFIILLKADESIHHIKLRQSCLCLYTFWFLPHSIAVMMIPAARKKMALKGLLLVCLLFSCMFLCLTTETYWSLFGEFSCVKAEKQINCNDRTIEKQTDGNYSHMKHSPYREFLLLLGQSNPQGLKILRAWDYMKPAMFILATNNRTIDALFSQQRHFRVTFFEWLIKVQSSINAVHLQFYTHIIGGLILNNSNQSSDMAQAMK